MEGKEKEILDRNKEFLVRNIVLTPEFYELLQTYRVIPTTMIMDVKSAQTKEDKNKRLLETVKLRGCDSYRKLRHVLSLTGHTFLADHLYEEETDTKLLRYEELFGKFPHVFNHISDDAKTKLLRYLETKLKEKMLANAWMDSPLERSEILESRKTGFENEKDLRTKLEKYKRQVNELNEELAAAREELSQSNVGMKIQLRETEEAEKRFKQELCVQSRFNAANNSSVMRLKGQFLTVHSKLNELNRWIRGYLRMDSVGDTQESTVTSAIISVLENNISKLMDRANQHAVTLDRSTSERDTILNLLKKPVTRAEPLSQVVRKYIEKENKTKMAICRELYRLNEILRESCHVTGSHSSSGSSLTETTELRQIRNVIATFRVEAQHLQKKLSWKDARIADLVQEVAALRQKTVGESVTHTLCPSEKKIKDGGNTAVREFQSSPLSSPRNMYVHLDEYRVKSDNSSPPPMLASTREVSEVHYESLSPKRQSSLENLYCTVGPEKYVTYPGTTVQHKYDANSTGKSQRSMSFDWLNANAGVAKGDGDTIAIQEVTSYMEEKIAEGKLPPIIPNTSYLDFGNVHCNS